MKGIIFLEPIKYPREYPRKLKMRRDVSGHFRTTRKGVELFVLVMAFALGYLDIAGFLHDTVDQAVTIINAPAPESREISLEWFWFADTFVAIAFNVFDKHVNAF